MTSTNATGMPACKHTITKNRKQNTEYTIHNTLRIHNTEYRNVNLAIGKGPVDGVA
jgi:hypothetical protein